MLQAEVDRCNAEKKEAADRGAELRKDFITAIEEKDEQIQTLEGKLRGIDSKHKQKLTKIGNKKEETQKRLNLEEKERELCGLKLEQVLANNKKLQLQKKFLEKQLEKDLREIHLEMNKIQIEIQQDQLMNSGSALQRFKSVYQVVSDQLSYIQQIVGFMDFDQQTAPGGSGIMPTNQTFDEIAREITERLHPGSEPHQQPPQSEGLVAGSPLADAARGIPPYRSDQTQSPVEEVAVAHQHAHGELAQASPPGVSPGIRSPPFAGTGAPFLPGVQRRETFPRLRGSPPKQPSLGGTNAGTPQQVLLSLEECLNSHPLELMYALLELTDDLYKDAKMQQSEHLTRLMELTQGHVDRVVVNEIVDKYLIQSKVQFQQNIFRLNEKCKALEVERKALQMKFQRANQSIQRIEEQEHMLDQKNRLLLEAEQRNVIPEEPPSAEGKHSTPRLQPAEASPHQVPPDYADSGAGGNSMGGSPEHDASLLGPQHMGDAYTGDATREGPAHAVQLEQ